MATTFYHINILSSLKMHIFTWYTAITWESITLQFLNERLESFQHIFTTEMQSSVRA